MITIIEYHDTAPESVRGSAMLVRTARARASVPGHTDAEAEAWRRLTGYAVLTELPASESTVDASGGGLEVVSGGAESVQAARGWIDVSAQPVSDLRANDETARRLLTSGQEPIYDYWIGAERPLQSYVRRFLSQTSASASTQRVADPVDPVDDAYTAGDGAEWVFASKVPRSLRDAMRMLDAQLSDEALLAGHGVSAWRKVAWVQVLQEAFPAPLALHPRQPTDAGRTLIQPGDVYQWSDWQGMQGNAPAGSLSTGTPAPSDPVADGWGLQPA